MNLWRQLDAPPPPPGAPAARPTFVPRMDIALRAIGMATAVALDPRLILFLSVAAAAFLPGGARMSSPVLLAWVALLATAASLSARTLRRCERSRSALATVTLGFAAGALWSVLHSGSLDAAAATAALPAPSAVALAALVALALPRSEQLSGIGHHLRLLEWADLNKPLMRRLSLEAPGTYAHTIATANLCEAACNAIGADGLLGLVGTYYHDIGKLRRPTHFVENQSRGRNPHDKLKAATSAGIIRNHVREGVELAAEHGVPDEVRAFIPEHHGTIPIAFFLQKARERDPSVSETEFHYGGPVPRSAETAVCMLADGVEAAVRSLADPTPAQISAAVQGIIQRRMDEGQLRDAPLTMRDLAVIHDQFVRILTGMHHGRVDYPPRPITSAASRSA